MTGEKVLEVLRAYRKLFNSLGVEPVRAAVDEPPYDQTEMLAHCHQMLDRMEEFVAEDRMGKVFRWLGFLQGVLWSQGIYSLDELMNHNRPAMTEPEEDPWSRR